MDFSIAILATHFATQPSHANAVEDSPKQWRGLSEQQMHEGMLNPFYPSLPLSKTRPGIPLPLTPRQHKTSINKDTDDKRRTLQSTKPFR